ncbi:hypothetical protein D3C84_562020 [compost metagenome]
MQRRDIRGRAADRAIQRGRIRASERQAERRLGLLGLGRFLLLRWRLAHEAVAGARQEVLEVVFRVVPAFDRPCHGAADIVAGPSALGFPNQDALAHQAGQEARAVAHLHPADGVLAGAPERQMLIAFQGVCPGELAVQIAFVLVGLYAYRFNLDHTAQRMQLRAGGENVQLRTIDSGLDCQVGIAAAREVANARHQATGEVGAHGLQQLFAQGAEGLGVEQQHAFVAEPDGAFVGAKMQVFGQVFHVWKAQVGNDVLEHALAECLGGVIACLCGHRSSQLLLLSVEL